MTRAIAISSLKWFGHPCPFIFEAAVSSTPERFGCIAGVPARRSFVPLLSSLASFGLWTIYRPFHKNL